jgi:hypothetical protein
MSKVDGFASSPAASGSLSFGNSPDELKRLRS